jgi:XRE family transcriptional regulator of biofilm formation
MNLGDRLRRERDKKGWSVRQLARTAKVPFETISRLENSKQRSPSLPVAMRLARTLGVTLDYLAGMYEEDDPEGGLGGNRVSG